MKINLGFGKYLEEQEGIVIIQEVEPSWQCKGVEEYGMFKESKVVGTTITWRSKVGDEVKKTGRNRYKSTLFL